MRLLSVHAGLSFLILALSACGGGNGPEDLCQAGQLRCQGDLLEHCVDGAWYSLSDCGALGQSCGTDPDTGELACLDDPPACTEEERRCMGDTLQRCEAGAWQIETDCAQLDQSCGADPDTGELACLDDPPVCTDDDLRCTGETLERCTAGAWQTDTDCAQLGQTCGIDAGTGELACLEDPPDCTEDELRCVGDTLERCYAGAWQMDADCAQLGQTCGMDPGTGELACLEDPLDCTEDELRCVGDTLERCVAGAWQADSDCLATGELCRVDGDSGIAGCQALSWNQIPIEIDDPIVNGSSLMLPVDGPSNAYDAASGLMATSFGSAYDDPNDLFLWLLDTATGRHYKLSLSGDPMAADTPFCVGGEDWCQYIGFDPVSNEWIVAGPSSPTLMRVTAAGVASQTATSGDRPPDSWISRTYRYDWVERTLWEYGAVGPSEFSTGLYALDLDTGVWSLTVSGLPAITDNCLVADPVAGLHYSFGGETTEDGGETVDPVVTYMTIDDQSGIYAELPLPPSMGTRKRMNCALDQDRGLIFLLGGSLVNDYWNEIENQYHNDLWVLRLSDGVFFELLPDSPMGIFLDPDDYGDRAFEAFPEGPNFGPHPGLMTYASEEDRIMVVGEVPIFTHGQVYWMDLDGVEALLPP